MATTQVFRSERFPDLADEVLFPRLSDAKLAWLSKRGPCTEAARGVLALDAAGYLLCGSAAAGCDGHLSWPLKDRDRISSRRSAQECSPPETCAPERQTGWRARLVTAPSRYGSRTTCWRARPHVG
jgi:hypothetical protein